MIPRAQEPHPQNLRKSFGEGLRKGFKEGFGKASESSQEPLQKSFGRASEKFEALLKPGRLRVAAGILHRYAGWGGLRCGRANGKKSFVNAPFSACCGKRGGAPSCADPGGSPRTVFAGSFRRRLLQTLPTSEGLAPSSSWAAGVAPAAYPARARWGVASPGRLRLTLRRPPLRPGRDAAWVEKTKPHRARLRVRRRLRLRHASHVLRRGAGEASSLLTHFSAASKSSKRGPNTTAGVAGRDVRVMEGRVRGFGGVGEGERVVAEDRVPNAMTCCGGVALRAGWDATARRSCGARGLVFSSRKPNPEVTVRARYRDCHRAHRGGVPYATLLSNVNPAPPGGRALPRHSRRFVGAVGEAFRDRSWRARVRPTVAPAGSRKRPFRSWPDSVQLLRDRAGPGRRSIPCALVVGRTDGGSDEDRTERSV